MCSPYGVNLPKFLKIFGCYFLISQSPLLRRAYAIIIPIWALPSSTLRVVVLVDAKDSSATRCAVGISNALGSPIWRVVLPFCIGYSPFLSYIRVTAHTALILLASCGSYMLIFAPPGEDSLCGGLDHELSADRTCLFCRHCCISTGICITSVSDH